MDSETATKSVLKIGLSLTEQGQPVLVEDIELQSATMRHRIVSTKSNRALQEVLCADLTDFIQDVITRMKGDRFVYSDVDAVLKLKELTLRGLQVLSSRRNTGEQKLSLRFVDVSGNVQSLLRDVVPRAQAETKAIAMEAIERVVGRTYDVARVLENVYGMAEPGSAFEGCTSAILRRREDLLFRLDLLQRAVSDQNARPDPAKADIVRQIASG